MEYKFVPVDFTQNQQYLDQIIELFQKNKELWINDTYQSGNYIAQFINECVSVSPWFQAVLNNKNEFMGFIYLCRWEGKQPFYHSVQLQSMMERKFWGKETEKAFHCLLKLLFVNLNRVQMKIDENNIMACKLAERMGFTLEGTIRHATYKDGIPINYKLYSILKEEYINDGILIKSA